MTWRVVVPALLFAVVVVVASWGFVERPPGEALPAMAPPEATTGPAPAVVHDAEDDELRSRATLAPAPSLVSEADEEQGVATPEEAQALTRPLIGAIRARFDSDEARRAAMLEALGGSGASSEPWTAYSVSALGGFRHALRAIEGIEVDARHATCFRAGCQATVIFRDEAAYREASEAFRHIDEQEPLHGGRIQTPAVQRGDGTWEGNWIVLRPS